MSIRKPGIFHYLALIGVLAVALFFRAFNIGAIGYGNTYYAATVFSMLTSWKNFFFASFDPAGFVSVDKPPLGFWIQAANAAIFGFQGWALMLPQIAAGVLSCLVLYWLVRRVFGPGAGLLAAFILAVTPIAVAAERNNTIDGQLLLTLLLSTAALMLAVERGSWLWLALGAALIGLGFNIKMLQAYMILPAFYGLYFLAARTTWLKKLAHLAVATVVILVISFAWVLVVDATPTDQRPYVGSSTDNTVMELIAGHNGAERLGQIVSWFGFSSQRGRGPAANSAPARIDSQPPLGLPPFNPGDQPQGAFPPPPRADGAAAPQFGPGNGQPGGPGNPGPGANETGQAGPFRLFTEQLAGQVTWLLPLALVMLLALIFRKRWSWPLNAELQSALFWGLWLVPMAIFFSYAGLFHRYYLEMLAPAVTALVAGGLVVLTRDFAAGRWSGWLLPLGIVASAAFEATIMARYWAGWAGWAVVLTLLFGTVAGLGLMLMRFVPPLLRQGTRQMVMVGLVALLAAPVLWSTTPLAGNDVALPYAGPELLRRNVPASQPRVDDNRQLVSFQIPAVAGNDNALIQYLAANYHGETFIVAGMSSNAVAPIIIETGKAAMAIGGFSGSDPILTADQFAGYVQRGELRFVLLGAGLNGPGGGQREITQWVQAHCQPVDLSSDNQFNPRDSRQTLYDCK